MSIYESLIEDVISYNKIDCIENIKLKEPDINNTVEDILKESLVAICEYANTAEQIIYETEIQQSNVILEEFNFRAILYKFKEAIKNFFLQIKRLFYSIFKMVIEDIKNNEEFYNKYEKEIYLGYRILMSKEDKHPEIYDMIWFSLKIKDTTIRSIYRELKDFMGFTDEEQMKKDIQYNSSPYTNVDKFKEVIDSQVKSYKSLILPGIDKYDNPSNELFKTAILGRKHKGLMPPEDIKYIFINGDKIKKIINGVQKSIDSDLRDSIKIIEDLEKTLTIENTQINPNVLKIYLSAIKDVQAFTEKFKVSYVECADVLVKQARSACIMYIKEARLNYLNKKDMNNEYEFTKNIEKELDKMFGNSHSIERQNDLDNAFDKYAKDL